MLIGVLFLVIAIALLSRPLFKTYSDSEQVEAQGLANQRKNLNIELYEQKKVQLELDYVNGLLDDEAKEQAQNEIEHSLIQDAASSESNELVMISNTNAKMLAAVFLVFIPVFSIVVYAYLMPQNYDQVVLGTQDVKPQNDQHSQLSQQQVPDIDTMLVTLENKLKEDPDNIQGWNMLARSYTVTKRYSDAVTAYEKALELSKTSPQEIPDLEISYVEALMQTGEKQNYKKANEVLSSLLKINPNNGDALWFKGFVDFESGNKAQAIENWTHLLTLLPANGEQANIVNTYLNRVIVEYNKELSPEKQIAVNQPGPAADTQIQTPAPAAENGPAPGQQLTGSKEEKVFIANMISRVEQRVKDNPQDVGSWKKLGKSYDVLGRSVDSANAYATAVALDTSDVGLLISYSDAVIKTGQVDQLDKARIVFAQLLDKNAQNADALFLSGTLAAAAGDFEQAKLFWGNLLPLLTKDSPAYQNVERNLQSLP